MKILICEVCGKFLTYQKKYCSNSCSAKGRVRSKGWKHSEETKQKIRKSNQGKKRSDQTRRNCSESRKKYYQDHPEDLIAKSRTMKSIYQDYEFDPDRRMSPYRRLAIETYGYECALCGETSTHVRMDAHHIDGNHDNNDIDNLCVLCCSCHCRIHPKTSLGDNTTDPELTRKILESRHQIELSNTEMEELDHEN